MGSWHRWWLARAVAAVLRLVWPPCCAGCDREGWRLCPSCHRQFCVAAQQISPADLAVCAATWGVGAWHVVAYAGTCAQVIRRWKDGGRADVSDYLAHSLAIAVAAVLARQHRNAPRRGSGATGRLPWLVPIPSSRKAIRRRGDDVVWQVARRAGRHVVIPASVTAPAVVGTATAGPAAAETGSTGTEMVRTETAARPGTAEVTAANWVPACGAARALRQRRAVADQAGLSARQRGRNVAGAYAVRARYRSRLAGQPCIVVDDVVTTGHSVAEAVRALRSVGAQVLGVASICATPRHNPTRHLRLD